ncbi:MAG: hypothetical protein M3R00_01175 [Pseudomonadota bacterium]|nr:hypothetical protein [Pseudomonadota bacterium]
MSYRNQCRVTAKWYLILGEEVKNLHPGYLNPDYLTIIPDYEPVQQAADKWAITILQAIYQNNAIINIDTLLNFLFENNAIHKKRDKYVVPIAIQWAIFKAMILVKESHQHPISEMERLDIIKTLRCRYRFNSYYSHSVSIPEAGNVLIEEFEFNPYHKHNPEIEMSKIVNPPLQKKTRMTFPGEPEGFVYDKKFYDNVIHPYFMATVRWRNEQW